MPYKHPALPSRTPYVFNINTLERCLINRLNNVNETPRHVGAVEHAMNTIMSSPYACRHNIGEGY
jgi:hypothetical protein